MWSCHLPASGAPADLQPAALPSNGYGWLDGSREGFVAWPLLCSRQALCLSLSAQANAAARPRLIILQVQGLLHTLLQAESFTACWCRYRDPKTNKGYHDAAAFKELRRRHGERMAARLTAPLARPQGPAVAQGSYPVAVSVAVPGSSSAGAATSMATISPVSGPIPGSAPAQYGPLPGAHPSPQQPRYEPQSGHPGVYHQASSPAQPSALQQTPAGAHATASSAAVVPQYQQPQHQQPPQQQQQRASAPFPAQPPHTAQGFSQPLPPQQYQHQAPVGAGSQQEPVPQHMYQQAATATVPQHVAAVSQQPGAALASWGAEAQGTSALADGDMQQQGLPPQQLPHGSM